MTDALRQFPGAAEGLEFEAGLFTASEPLVGLWTSRESTIVCPAAYRSRPGFSDALARASDRNTPVLIRPTGGGAVPQGSGVLNLVLALTVSEGFTIEDGYRLLTRTIVQGLGKAGETLETGATPGSFCDGAWNLSVSGRKVAGTAQRWRPLAGGVTRVMAHALILTHGDTGQWAAAVDAFHRDLGLGRVRADAHTTLETALGLSAATMHRLAETLHATALRQISEIDTDRDDRAHRTTAA